MFTKLYGASSMSSLCLTILLPIALHASGASFMIEDGVLKGVELNGEENISIPDGVTCIGDNAFSCCDDLKSVILPISVKIIGEYAFEDCSRLKTIVMPDGGVEQIGNDAFNGCSLKSINLPDSLQNVADWAFRRCEASELTVSVGNPYYKALSGMLLTKDGRKLLRLITISANITIPDSVMSIGKGAFADCHGLTSVTIPDSVVSIGDSAFWSCWSLENVTIGNGVKSFGSEVFDECDELQDVVISADNPYYKSVSGMLLTKDGKLLSVMVRGSESITIPDGVTDIGERAFSGYAGLISVTIPNTVTNIGDEAFIGKGSLTSIVIPSSVKSIGASAFEECWSLETVMIREGVERIGESAFAYCESLTSINIPDSVQSIGRGAFGGCYSLNFESSSVRGAIVLDGWMLDGEGMTDSGTLNLTGVRGVASGAVSGVRYTGVLIPANLTRISEGAFLGCDNVSEFIVSADNPRYKSIDGALYSKDGTVLIAYPSNKPMPVTLPSGITRIGSSAFSWNSNLTSISLPDGVTSIGDLAFNTCTSLSQIVLPQSLEKIGDEAFRNCTSLSQIALPQGLGEIGWGAFQSAHIEDIVIPDSVTKIGISVFVGCNSLTNVVLPCNMTAIPVLMFNGCSNLRNIDIPASVRTIGKGAFSSCMNLTNIVFLGNAPEVEQMAFGDVDPSCVVLVHPSSDGWGVEIPGKWNGLDIRYSESSAPVGPPGTTVPVGGGKTLTVPQAWLSEHTQRAATDLAANGTRTVAECYVLGLDPEDATNDFRIVSFPLKVDGTPDMSKIVFDPPQAQWNVPGARAVIRGAATLDAENWPEVTDENKASFRFFKVTVELP